MLSIIEHAISSPRIVAAEVLLRKLCAVGDGVSGDSTRPLRRRKNILYQRGFVACSRMQAVMARAAG